MAEALKLIFETEEKINLFKKDYLFIQPYAQPRCALDYRKLIGWEKIFSIMERGHPDCWLAKNGKLHLNDNVKDFSQAIAQYKEGYTIVVRHSEVADESLRAIAMDFQDHFQKPVDIQLYGTPHGRRGFGWHYDQEDVFVIQSSGTKEFFLRKNKDKANFPFSATEKFNLDDRAEGPELRCLLHPGDFLYIPAGYWHTATAHEDSFHLSIGVSFHKAL